ncbi:hypothetical protein DQW50_13860 [Halorubrum sp. 48-1-W]|uniref:DUF5305 domain-containing protein n=1 Tax=Halorubrum sp. 48-1-W TaxID=2249761 RepID=UPI000DCE4183|nr:DUF5305 domain-containing protein [Halorubrum sp. 48-1-W]RAW44537.1 hypothetical protein DQW50_13860 [Halorubrum sp. 48-1-W]
MSTPPDPDDHTSAGPDDTRLRLRAFLDAQFTVLLVVCLLVAVAGGALVYTTHVDPGTETQTRTVSSWTVETGYTHSAEVTEPSPVFSIGDELTDRETYFATIAPELDVAAEVVYAADSAEDVDVAVDSELVVRNVGEEGVVYWEQNETVDSTTAEGVDPRETVSAPFTLNSTAIDGRVSAIDEQLGASPGETETFVVTDVEVAGTLNGQDVTYTRSVEFGISHEGDTYTVSDPGVQSDSDDQQVTEAVERTYGPLRGVGGPALLVVGLLGAAGLVYGRYGGSFDVSEAERAYLSYRDDRSEFDEWITRVRLPPAVYDRPEAHAEELRDLVDFSIDNDTGVVEDPNTGAFHAVAGEFVYTYRPPSVPVAGGLDDDPETGDGSGDPSVDGSDVKGSDVGEGTDEGSGLFTGSLLGGGSDSGDSDDEGDPDDGADESGEGTDDRSDRGS